MPDTATLDAKTTTRSAPHAGKARAEEVLDETAQTLRRTRQSANQIADETMACVSDTFSAAMACGSEAAWALNDLGKSYMDACSDATSALSEVTRDSLACRTPADVAALQKKSMEAFNRTFEVSLKLCNDLYTSWSKAFEPFVARAADVPERMFRAIAD